MIINNIICGGICINDTVMHTSSQFLPFGGVGESGMGSYHGKSSFDTFTHYKSVYSNTNKSDNAFRYPPYSKRLEMLKKSILK